MDGIAVLGFLFVSVAFQYAMSRSSRHAEKSNLGLSIPPHKQWFGTL